MRYPSNDTIAELWLKTLGLTADDIGTELPADPATWANGGYVQATATGGSPAIHVPMHAPTVQIDCWACRLNSELAPWNKAGDLAGQIVDGAFAHKRPVDLMMPSDYKGVRVHSAYALTEPRPIPGDEAGFARVSFDIAVRWSWSS